MIDENWEHVIASFQSGCVIYLDMRSKPQIYPKILIYSPILYHKL